MQHLRNVSEAEWWSWLDRCGDMTFFHTPVWARVLVDSFPDATVETSLFELADGARVLMPLICRRRLHGMVTSLESMPFGTYGGFLSERQLARKEMLAIIDSLKRTHPTVGRLVISPNPLGRHSVPEDIFVCQDSIHFLCLDEGYDSIWRTRFSRGLRYSIRKSLRRGTTVGLTTRAADFEELASLYHRTARRWGRKPRFGDRFFDNVSRLNPGVAQLWVTRIEGQMASGIIIFTYGGHQAPYPGGFDRAFTGYDPNNLMYAEAIKWGAGRGLRHFNFLSSGGVKGVEHFKASFGTQRRFFHFFRYEHVALRMLHAKRSRRAGAGDAVRCPG